jgi:hypothetical protein
VRRVLRKETATIVSREEMPNQGGLFERISLVIASDSTTSRLVHFEAFALLLTVALNEFLISSQRLLRFRQAADARVGLTQLKVGGVTVRRELPCGFEAFDCASLFTFIAVRVPAAEIP